MRAFRSQGEREQTAGSEGRLLFDLRESFAESFAYDVFSWISIPPSKIAFRPTQPAERQDGEDKGIGAPETDGTEGPVALYTTTNSDIPIKTVGKVVPFEGDGGIAPASNTSGPLIDVDDFRADARFAGVDGSGYSVVVLDTGIDLDDPFFGPDTNGDGVSDRIVYHYDFADGDANASDFDGHGSNVTSIVASSDGTYTGMAPGADIISLKVFTNAGAGNFGYLEQALQWVISNADAYNIASINMSLGDGGNYSTAIGLYGIADELSVLAAMDVIVVSASGNDFYEVNSIQGVAYPSADPNSLSVGAVYDGAVGGFSYSGGAIAYSTTADQITPFSQRDHELSDIFAPGAPITGAGAGAGLVTMHGTSQASPHIAGIAALAQQLAEQELGRKLTVTEFTGLLAGSGDSIFDGDDENDNVANTNITYQRVNMLALAEAILALAPPDPRGPTYFQVAAIDQAKPEGDSGTTSFSFQVIRSGDTSEADTIDYSVAGSGAAPAQARDFLGGSFPSGSVTFDVGETSKTVTVQVTGDTELEPDESFTLTIANVPANGQIVVPSDEATILNDDGASPEPVVLLQADFDQEGDTGGFVYVDGLFGGANPQPYADGSWSDQVLDVTLGGRDRSNIFDMSGGWQTNFTVATEAEVTLSFAYVLTIDSDYEASEFTQVLVSIDGASPILVDQLTGDGNGGSDQTTGLQTFTLALGTLTPGTYSLAIGAYNNKKTWSNEQSQLTIDDVLVTGVPTAAPPDGSVFAIVADDAVKAEGDAGATAFTFTVSRSGDSAQPASVDYAVSGPGADQADFSGGLLPSGTVDFAAGEASKMLTVEVAGDTDFEGDEAFTVTLTNPSGASTIATASANGTILNDDPAPPSTFLAIAAVDSVKAEGDTGFTDFTFILTRSGDTSGAGTVFFETTGDVNSYDFYGAVPPDRTLFFSSNETSKTINVRVAGDTVVESDEAFTLTLSNASAGSQIITATADGMILNDDEPPATFFAVAADDAVKFEGDSGATPLTFTVSRSGDLSSAGSVNYSVFPGSPNTADGADFVGSLWPNGTLDFAAGEASKTLTLEVQGDLNNEADETFLVRLSQASIGSAIATDTATGQILNDDTYDRAYVSIAPLQAGLPESDSNPIPHGFQVTRTGDLSTAVTLDYAVTGGAADGADFVGNILPSGTVSLSPSQAAATIIVSVEGDRDYEPDESFVVTISNPSANAEIVVASAVSTILNDDPAPPPSSFAIAATDAVKAEGDAGATAFTFTVTRSGDTAQAGSVDYAVTSSQADGGDFLGGVLPSGSVSFAAGETSRTVTIQVSGDTDFESDEAFTVTLSNASAGSEITTTSAAGTILNDDLAPPATFFAITPLDAVKAEGDAGATAFTFNVTRSGDTAQAGSVDYAVTSSQADGGDFQGGVLPSGTVNFATSETSRIVTIQVSGDTDFESDEDFTVTLSNPSAGSEITTPSATGTIVNDDPAAPSTFFAIAANDAVKAEGDAGSTAFTFTVTRSGDSSQAGSVDYSVTSSQADGGDFQGGVLPSGTVNFATGETSRTVTIQVSGDTDFESDEDFTVTLSNPSAGSEITTASAAGTILNDDPAAPSTFFAIAANDAVKAEGDAGSTAFTFTVTRSGDSSQAGSVDYSVTSSQADGGDFQGGLLPSGSVSFAAGETSKTVTLQIAGDTQVEGDETFTVTLSNPSAGSAITTVSAEGTILNDDTAPPGNPVTLIDESFDGTGDTGGFSYADGSFGGANPQSYADGAWADGTLRVDLGGADNSNVTDMSGGWTRDFTLDAESEVTLSFLYELVQSNGYESDEVSQLLVSIDGGPPILVNALTGDGNGGGPLTTGPQTYSAMIGVLAAGSHSLTIGGFNNKKTWNNEATELTIDDVSLVATPTAPPVPIESSFAIAPLDAEKAEGDGGPTALSFTVTRSGDLTAGASVDLAVAGSGATPADAADFVGGLLPAGSLTFGAGESSRTLIVEVAGDTDFEGDETFLVTLVNPSPGSDIVTASAGGTILNDDSAPVGPIVLIDADFNANGDTGGFVYADGTFGGANPQAYAEGSWQDQALTIALGGIDGSDVLDISGAWESSFVLATEMNVTLSFSYELILSPNFEGNEFGQVLYSLDGGPAVLVDQVTGNGNGGAADTTGPQTYLLDLGPLAAGTHSIALGGLINQKTFFNESADLIIDDVLITGEMTVVADVGGAAGGSPWQSPTADPLAPNQESEILTVAGL